MNKDYTLCQLGDLLVELGKKKHSSSAYAFAYGTITGMLNNPIQYWSNSEIQKYINEKYLEIEKELAAA